MVLGITLVTVDKSASISFGEAFFSVIFMAVWALSVYTAGLGAWKKIGLMFLGIYTFQGLSRIRTGDRYHVGSTLLGALIFTGLVLGGLPYGLGKFCYLAYKSLSA